MALLELRKWPLPDNLLPGPLAALAAKKRSDLLSTNLPAFRLVGKEPVTEKNHMHLTPTNWYSCALLELL